MNTDEPVSLVGLIDESYRVVAGGHYVLAAAVAAAERLAEIRERLRPLPPGTKRHVHWVDESDPIREKVITAVEALDLPHVVVAATPIGKRRQERARALCLERLMWELHELEVRHVVIEGRSHQDVADRRVIGGLRSRKVVPRSLTFEFGTKRDPELWLPDAVAGAVMLQRCDGDDRFVSRLTTLRVIEIPGTA